jgi:hypothetical protein
VVSFALLPFCFILFFFVVGAKFEVRGHILTLRFKMTLHEYDYVFAIGTLFAMLDAYNNGASKSLPLYVTLAAIHHIQILIRSLCRRCRKLLGYQRLIPVYHI